VYFEYNGELDSMWMFFLIIGNRDFVNKWEN